TRRGCSPPRCASNRRWMRNRGNSPNASMPLSAPPRTCSTPCSTPRASIPAATSRRSATSRWPSCSTRCKASSRCSPSSAACACVWHPRGLPCAATRSCCAGCCRTSSPTRCATPSAVACCWARAAPGTRCASKYGTPVQASPPNSVRASSANSSGWSGPRRGARRAWAWACRSATASPPCCSTGWPCIRARATATPPRRQAVRRGGSDEQLPLTVLCLDDDAAILDGMRALLGRWGVDCRTARDVTAAAAELRRGPVDLILADYHLADGIDGLQALQQLRAACDPLPPAALITADGSSELKQRARALGYPLLHKPVKPAALRALLTALVRKQGEGRVEV